MDILAGGQYTKPILIIPETRNDTILSTFYWLHIHIHNANETNGWWKSEILSKKKKKKDFKLV